jgi:hypothetical protein
VTQYGGEPYEKAVFLRGIRDIRDDALTPHIIRGSFRKRGIYPFNPDLVVKPLSDREESQFIPLRGFDTIDSAKARGEGEGPLPEASQARVSPVPSSSSIELPNTPRSLKKSFQKIRPYLPSSDEKLHRRIQRIERFTTIEYEESILKDDVISKFKTVRTRYTATSQSRRQITKTGAITTRDARAKIAERTEQENQQWVRKVRRENKRKWAEEEAEAEKQRRVMERIEYGDLDLNSKDSDLLFGVLGLYEEDREGDSSLRP